MRGFGYLLIFNKLTLALLSATFLLPAIITLEYPLLTEFTASAVKFCLMTNFNGVLHAALSVLIPSLKPVFLPAAFLPSF